MEFKPQKVTYSLQISRQCILSINLRTLNKAIRVQYYGYDIGSPTILTVSKTNEVQYIVK